LGGNHTRPPLTVITVSMRSSTEGVQGRQPTQPFMRVVVGHQVRTAGTPLAVKPQPSARARWKACTSSGSMRRFRSPAYDATNWARAASASRSVKRSAVKLPSCAAATMALVRPRSPDRRRCSPPRPLPDSVLRRPANGHKVVHELMFRPEPGRDRVSVIDRAAGYLRCC